MNFKFILLAILGIAAQSSLLGQHRQERVQAFRADVLVEELQLTTAESAAFFPLYEQYAEERRAWQQSHKQLQRQLLLVSDEEAPQKIEELFQQEEAEIELKRRYFKQFLTVLPVRKVIRIPVAEREFKKRLLQYAGDRDRRGRQ